MFDIIAYITLLNNSLILCRNMNAVEEIYVLSPSVPWSRSVARQGTYLPQQNWYRTGPEEKLERETASALAEFDEQMKHFDDSDEDEHESVRDKHVNNFENKENHMRAEKVYILSDDSVECSILCLDTSSLCLDSMELPQVNIFISYMESFSFLFDFPQQGWENQTVRADLINSYS